jgi:hypothetical protein
MLSSLRSSVSLTVYLYDLHSKVLDPLFVLLAIVLELPEERFTRIHQYPVKSEVWSALNAVFLLLIECSVTSVT